MDKVDIIWLVLIALIIYIIIFIVCLPIGIKLCKSNNAWGILILAIPLNLVGLILSICLIYNARHGKYDGWLKERKKWNKFLNSNNLTLKEYLKETKKEI